MIQAQPCGPAEAQEGSAQRQLVVCGISLALGQASGTAAPQVTVGIADVDHRYAPHTDDLTHALRIHFPHIVCGGRHLGGGLHQFTPAFIAPGQARTLEEGGQPRPAGQLVALKAQIICQRQTHADGPPARALTP